MVPTEFWDAESDLGTQMTLASIEQARRFNDRKRQEEEARSFLSVLLPDYGSTEMVVTYAVDSVNGDVDFVRSVIDDNYRVALKYNRHRHAVNLMYRYEIMALNNLVSH